MSETLRPTKKQRELLDFIEKFIVDHGYSPSYREIMNGCQYNSVATVALHVGSLIKRGHLRKRDHSARSLEVVHTDDRNGGNDNMGHEEWLLRRIESYIFADDTEDPQAAPEASDIETLINALHLLGLGQQAEALESRLSDIQDVVA